MAPRFLQRISDTFKQYLSPRKPALTAKDASRHALPYPVPPQSPRNIFPVRQITPHKRDDEWEPVTPEQTPVPRKRKRSLQLQDVNKRKRSLELQDVNKRWKGERGEYTPAYDTIKEEADFVRSVETGFDGDTLVQDQHDESESSDEEDDDQVNDTMAVKAPLIQYISSDSSSSSSYVSDSSAEQGIRDNITVKAPVDPYISSNSSSKAYASSVEQELDDNITVKIPGKEDLNTLGDISDEESFDDLFEDEDHMVFADTDADDGADLESESDSFSDGAVEGDATIFEPSIFEEADDEGTMIADIRARVGSLDSDFVPRQFLLDRGWPEDAIWLVQRLHQRGHEPIFPSHWKMDYHHLPEGLFLPRNARRPPFIHSLRENDFRATKSLTRLIQMGPKIRDRITVNKAPEPLIVSELKKYMLWAAWDSDNQFPDYPVIDIHSDNADADVQTMQDEMLLRLSQLYQRWRDVKSTASSATLLPNWPEKQEMETSVPSLYGVLISDTKVGVVTFVPGNGGDSQGYLRGVGVFDFRDGDYDVWNALALALLVVHSRDRLVERGCGVARPWMRRRWGSRVSQDPDA